MSRFLTTLLTIGTLFATALSAATARADGGSLKGRFVYDGAAPAAMPLSITKDTEVCGKHNLVDESLVVAADGSLANVVVWLRTKDVPAPAAKADDKVTLDNHNCHFEPHVVGMQMGQTLEVKNSDPVAHNTKIDGQNLQVNPLIQAGTSFTQLVDAPEALPAPVSCSIHNWMSAKLVIRPNPYFAVSDAKGNFEIKNLPAGEYEFQVWQEKAGYITTAEVGGQSVTWPKGRVKWAAGTDLGTIKLSAEQFNK